jgi:hypothetical protein
MIFRFVCADDASRMVENVPNSSVTPTVVEAIGGPTCTPLI